MNRMCIEERADGAQIARSHFGRKLPRSSDSAGRPVSVADFRTCPVLTTHVHMESLSEKSATSQTRRSVPKVSLFVHWPCLGAAFQASTSSKAAPGRAAPGHQTPRLPHGGLEGALNWPLFGSPYETMSSEIHYFGHVLLSRVAYGTSGSFFSSEGQGSLCPALLEQDGILSSYLAPPAFAKHLSRSRFHEPE